jgi:hypothetical protein
MKQKRRALDKLTLDKCINVNTAHGIYAMGIFFLNYLADQFFWIGRMFVR